MPSDRDIELVDVSGDDIFSLLAGLLCDRPDQFRLDGLEERLDHGVEAPMIVKLRSHNTPLSLTFPGD